MLFVCSCGRVFRRKIWFDRHISKCSVYVGFAKLKRW
jgi:hypothetical protein